MANEYRWQLDYMFGTLTQAISTSDTTLQSAEFAGLPVISTGATYFPITLINLATHIRETVWVTAHTSGSTSVTAVRAKESTTAAAWPVGTPWILAPTTRDVTSISSSTSLPSDAHVGHSVVLNDKGEVREKTFQQGYLGHVRANLEHMNTSWDGAVTAVPNGSIMNLRTWTASGTTDASGFLPTTIPDSGFPVRLMTIQLTRIGGSSFFVPAVNTAAGATDKTKIRILATTPTGVLASTAITVCVTAIGY